MPGGGEPGGPAEQRGEGVALETEGGGGASTQTTATASLHISPQ